MLRRLLFVVLLALASVAQATVYTLPWGPKPQFIDANGAPMSGATLLTFTAGSSTPQITYTDSTGGVANPTTITLNTRGETPNEVWLTGSQVYKFVLKDSAGTTIWTVDNVSGVNDVTTVLDEWKAGPAPTFVSTTSFTLAGDQTTTFTVGRRIKTTNSGGTIYSTILTSAFVTVTTITVANDAGNLDSGLSAISYGILSAANSSIPSLKLTAGAWTLSNTVTTSAAFTASSTLTASSGVTLNGTVSPTQITSSQNDYNPTSLSLASTLRLNTDASRNVTGLQGGADGRILTLVNVGTTPLVLTNQDVASSAANRFLLKADTTLAADQAITLRYDGTTARWRAFTGGVSKQPTRQILTSGTAATYTTAVGATRIFIRMVGGGGGGEGSATAGGDGTASTWSGGSLSAGGGIKGTGGAGGAGGATSNCDVNLTGATGGSSSASSANTSGADGGSSVFGGAGRGGKGNAGGAVAGTAGIANTGGGGGSGGGGGAAAPNNGAGGAGGYCEKLILAPAATYTYTVGAGGTAGAGGGSIASGGVGGTGNIIVDEAYDLHRMRDWTCQVDSIGIAANDAQFRLACGM